MKLSIDVEIIMSLYIYIHMQFDLVDVFCLMDVLQINLRYFSYYNLLIIKVFLHHGLDLLHGLKPGNLWVNFLGCSTAYENPKGLPSVFWFVLVGGLFWVR